MHENVPVRFGRGRLDSLATKGLAAYLIATRASVPSVDFISSRLTRPCSGDAGSSRSDGPVPETGPFLIRISRNNVGRFSRPVRWAFGHRRCTYEGPPEWREWSRPVQVILVRLGPPAPVTFDVGRRLRQVSALLDPAAEQRSASSLAEGTEALPPVVSGVMAGLSHGTASPLVTVSLPSLGRQFDPQRYDMAFAVSA
jgi:hypothetical protein